MLFITKIGFSYLNALFLSCLKLNMFTLITIRDLKYILLPF